MDVKKGVWVIGLSVLLLVMAGSAQAWIQDVEIEPEMPTIYDAITIHTYGGEGNAPVFIDNTDFFREGTSLKLDLYVSTGTLHAITDWSYEEVIGTLPDGMYDLTVSEFLKKSGYDSYDYRNEYYTAFEVVPEPASLLLMALGMIVIRKKK